ncbi:Fic family protein [Curtobacterium flaccumfaciens pv. beticola]|uniref:Fic family protein n=1 Tax=Curtobacterium TaxID=2034 RepID=UPI0015804347|nr:MULTISPECIES: Fic family protein [Curtobacterium]MCS5486739.1 Fic family protein [Curtobacterium flaccumfaciens pv. basellae]MDK8172114.1 Fic family protein [Curtobacterium citreum]QKS17024.1 Fic family protein [Curtobacterium sp. Csp2]WIJ46406.1 Fic family protein [Curtobacterium citreum]
MPPRIADLDWAPDDGTAVLLARTTLALRALDEADGTGPLRSMLLRTDAVASSRIEHEAAGLEDVARALVGVRANTSATVMVHAAAALEGFVDAAGAGRIDEDALLAAHRRLLRDDPVDGPVAGRYRTVQNWIGGGATPRLATHVPPPPDLVPGLMADLFAFLDRDDLHPVAQAALAHAQFESIHPFTDGNGRIGRALVAAVLRRRGVTRTVHAPVSAALVADRDRYFAHLDRYRDGAVDEWVRDLAIALGAAADEALVTGLLLAEAASDRAATVCATGLHAVVGRGLDTDGVLTEDAAERLLTAVDPVAGPETLDAVVEDLCAAGALRPVTTRRRRRAWVAPAVVRELDAFTERVRDGVEARARRLEHERRSGGGA